MTPRLAFWVLAAVLLAAAAAETQQIEGGGPVVRSLDGVDGGDIRMHDDGTPPTMSEPASVNRAR